MALHSPACAAVSKSNQRADLSHPELGLLTIMAELVLGPPLRWEQQIKSESRELTYSNGKLPRSGGVGL